jgi:hypothetical protein
MDFNKSKIMLILGVMIFSTILISFSGCIGEDCSDCTNCTDCYIGINSTEESKLFDELDGIVKTYVAGKENITDKSLIWTSIKFKSKDEAFVSATVNNKTWDGTWKHSDNQWNPGDDFKSS